MSPNRPSDSVVLKRSHDEIAKHLSKTLLSDASLVETRNGGMGESEDAYVANIDMMMLYRRIEDA
jgi:hypothetical protein